VTAVYVPPSDLDAEQAVLGAMLLSKPSAVAAVDLLGVADFYKPAHGSVFAAIARLVGASQAVDVVTVADDLRQAGQLEAVGGTSGLLQIQNSTPVSANLRQYAGIVRDKALRRRLIAVASVVQGLAVDAETAEDALARAEQAVMDVDHPDGHEISVADSADFVLSPQVQTVGWKSPWSQVDRIADSLHPRRVTVLAGRPGAGKSVCALQVAAKVAEVAEVRYFSMEMTHDELTARLLSQIASVPAKRLREPAFQPKVVPAAGVVAGLRLTIDDTAAMTIAQIAARSRRHKAARGLGLIVIDYLQLITPAGRSGSREGDVALMSRSLKILARQLEVPIIVCAQLNREVDKRADKRPLLSDLRESGAIEQDADCVWLLHNPPVEVPGAEAELIVAKNRQGQRGTANLYWDGSYTRFLEFLGSDASEGSF
jgi:replicative DNA helicase